jgi:hypothetical protein
VETTASLAMGDNRAGPYQGYCYRAWLDGFISTSLPGSKATGLSRKSAADCPSSPWSPTADGSDSSNQQGKHNGTGHNGIRDLPRGDRPFTPAVESQHLLPTQITLLPLPRATTFPKIQSTIYRDRSKVFPSQGEADKLGHAMRLHAERAFSIHNLLS